MNDVAEQCVDILPCLATAWLNHTLPTTSSASWIMSPTHEINKTTVKYLTWFYKCHPHWNCLNFNFPLFLQAPEFTLLQSGSSIDGTQRMVWQSGPWASCSTTWCVETFPSSLTPRYCWVSQTGQPTLFSAVISRISYTGKKNKQNFRGKCQGTTFAFKLWVE